MKAIKHKPTGQWLMVNESEEYELTDCRVPIDGCIGTDEEILQDIEDYSDGELLAADMEVLL